MHPWAEVGDTVPAVGTPWVQDHEDLPLVGVRCIPVLSVFSFVVTFFCVCSPPPPVECVWVRYCCVCTAHPYSCVGNFKTT